MKLCWRQWRMRRWIWAETNRSTYGGRHSLYAQAQVKLRMRVQPYPPHKPLQLQIKHGIKSIVYSVLIVKLKLFFQVLLI